MKNVMAYILNDKRLQEVSKYEMAGSYKELRQMYFRQRKLEQQLDVLFQVTQLALLCAISFRL